MTEPDLAAENARLRALVDQLSVRVITAEDNRTDAADLQRENADLRKALAGTTSTLEAVAQLRAWMPDYCDGASYVAMAAVMAKKLLAELDRLNAELSDEIEWGIGCPESSGTWYQGDFTQSGAHHHAKLRADGHFPAWRRLGNWHNADEEQP